MEFKTDISSTVDGVHSIYGKPVEDLMRSASFTDVIFLLFSGKLPQPSERMVLDTLLVAATEHGVEVPSLYAPRVSVASGNDVHVGIAGGVLAIGTAHGGAGEASAMLLARPEDAKTLVEEYLQRKERMPGFGHKVYTDEDPRAKIIYEKVKEAGLPLTAFEKAYAIESALREAKGKTFPLNIDGAYAAGILALGLKPSAATALFVLSRVAGMGAHAIEELEQKGGYRRLTD